MRKFIKRQHDDLNPKQHDDFIQKQYDETNQILHNDYPHWRSHIMMYYMVYAETSEKQHDDQK